MGYKVLSVPIKEESISYIDSLHSILTYKKIFSGPKYLLSGIFGMAFKFTIHKKIYPSSPNMYGKEELLDGCIRIGVYSESHGTLSSNPIFEVFQREAIKKIKASIDNDTPVLFWGCSGIQFGIIVGYGDEDEVFYYKHRRSEEEKVMLYKNFGVTKDGVVYYQLIGPRVSIALKEIYASSLTYAIDEWETLYKLGNKTNNEFASGRKAYEFLISALKGRDFDMHGYYCSITYYSKLKRELFNYLKEVEKELPQVKEALPYYEKVMENFNAIEKLPLYDLTLQKEAKVYKEVIDLFKEAKNMEEEGIKILKGTVKEHLENRYVDLYQTEQFIGRTVQGLKH